jgi:hypothetical protein
MKGALYCTGTISWTSGVLAYNGWHHKQKEKREVVSSRTMLPSMSRTLFLMLYTPVMSVLQPLLSLACCMGAQFSTQVGEHVLLSRKLAKMN